MGEPTTQNDGLPIVVGVKDLAAFLKVEAATVYYWKAQKKITPLVDTGRVLRFDLRQVIEELKPQDGGPTCVHRGNPLKLVALNRSLKTSDGNLAREETGNGKYLQNTER